MANLLLLFHFRRKCAGEPPLPCPPNTKHGVSVPIEATSTPQRASRTSGKGMQERCCFSPARRYPVKSKPRRLHVPHPSKKLKKWTIFGSTKKPIGLNPGLDRNHPQRGHAPVQTKLTPCRQPQNGHLPKRRATHRIKPFHVDP